MPSSYSNAMSGIEYSRYINDVLSRARKIVTSTRAATRARDDEEDTSHQVTGVDFHVKDSAKTHHTENYNLLEGSEFVPVFRRGEAFSLSIHFKEPVVLSKNNIKVYFLFGHEQRIGKGTLVKLPVIDSKTFTKEKTKWDIRLVKQEGNVLTLEIQVPSTIGVGLWRMNILNEVEGSEKVYHHKGSIYILFNPWNKEDLVYMAKEDMLQEYVMNPVGKFYFGTHQNPSGRAWIYDQFGYVALPASSFILEKSGIDYASRGNPIKVVRAISTMVSAEDDEGILVGNWAKQVFDGVHASLWTGSTSILSMYLSENGKPVKYGQCWVYAGLCTTICRALGIPCRNVTNYGSAHDKDESLSMDIYYNRNAIWQPQSEKFWNFHSWNECWMARPDLPAGYGGWQIIDGTPQETSEGIFRCGPASLEAIRKGNISLQYDTPYVFAEVNADEITWQEFEYERRYKKISIDTTKVGTLIVTKRIGYPDEFGIRDMEDITQEYKPKEGTVDERRILLVAARLTGKTTVHDLPPVEKEDVKFQLRDLETVPIGQPFQIIVDMQNNSDEKRTAHFLLSVSSVFYNGIIAHAVINKNEQIILEPKKQKQFIVQVEFNDYFDKLVDYSLMKLYVAALLQETKQSWAKGDDFTVLKPSLNIEVASPLKVHKPANFKFSFINPLKMPLENCILAIEGLDIVDAITVSIADVPAEENMSHVLQLMPRKSGKLLLTAVFNSTQLIAVVGSKHVVVEE